MWNVILVSGIVSILKDSGPTLRFAYGGSADFRGRDDTIFTILSAPNIALNMKTRDVETLLPRPTFLKSSFFTNAYLILYTRTTNKTVRVSMSASKQGYNVYVDSKLKKRAGKWEKTCEDDIKILSKKISNIVYTNEWYISFTRVSIDYPLDYETVFWRYNVIIKPSSSSTNLTSPHGLLGQSFDKQACVREGEKTNYDFTYIDQQEQARGAIEGTWEDYIVPYKYSTNFKYSRFYSNNVHTHLAHCISNKKNPIAEINDDLGKMDYKRKIQ